jgi:proteic killer suppression protein
MMDIVFADSRVRKACLRASGRLKHRLDDIKAAENMQELKALPGRLHALRADRKGQWAIDLEHPKRLIMEPLGDPLPYNEDGWLDLEKVTAVRVLGMEDYHGK